MGTHVRSRCSPVFCGAGPPRQSEMLGSLARMNLVSTQQALLPSLAPDHSGLEANVLRFDNPLQAARRCSTFPTDE